VALGGFQAGFEPTQPCVVVLSHAAQFGLVLLLHLVEFALHVADGLGGGRNWYGKHGGKTGAEGSRPSAAARARVATRGQKAVHQELRHRDVSHSAPRRSAARR
jgi:hypothetical protein